MAITAFSSSAYSASIYKCADEKGVVTYSNTRCAAGTYKKINGEIAANINHEARKSRINYLYQLVRSGKRSDAKLYAHNNKLDAEYNAAVADYPAFLKRVQQQRIAQEQQQRRRIAQMERDMASTPPITLSEDLMGQNQSEYGYQGPSGQRYKYDLNQEADKFRYKYDYDAQVKDKYSHNYGAKSDRRSGYFGGGQQ